MQEYGSPQKLATQWLAKEDDESLYPFSCSLCGLCHGVCPKKLDPSAMFLAMRRQLVARGVGGLTQHKTIRSYERRGSSSLLSWYYFPPGCETIFFPGCALPGSRPQTVTSIISILQENVPNIGFVFDCCTKPSHDLGEQHYFLEMFGALCTILQDQGVKKVLLACPNCHRIFSEYGKMFEVETLYDFFSEQKIFRSELSQEVTVHDPCGIRHEQAVQQSARKLVRQQGLSIQEMKHTGRKSLCCGEGGSAGYVRPDLSKQWTAKRVEEAAGRLVVTYCGGCTHILGKKTKVVHLLDLLVAPKETIRGRRKVNRALLIYWTRFWLIQKFKRRFVGGVRGNRKSLLPS